MDFPIVTIIKARIPLISYQDAPYRNLNKLYSPEIEQVDRPVLIPLKLESRLQAMAQTEGILMISEGTSSIEAGTVVMVQRFPIVGGQS